MPTFQGRWGGCGKYGAAGVRTWFNGFMDRTSKRRTVSLNAAYALKALPIRQVPDSRFYQALRFIFIASNCEL